MKLRAAIATLCVTVAVTALAACGHHSSQSIVPGVGQGPVAPFAAADQPLSEFANTPEVNTPGAKPAIFVANPASVLEFVETDDDNAIPKKNISGVLSQVSGASGIAVGPTGKIYVSTVSNGILVFAATQNGNTPPLQHIKGVAGVGGVALDSAGNIYVDEGSSDVKVFAPGATGTPAPIRTFSNAGIDNPKAMAIDASNRVYIANNDTDSVTVFAAGASGAVTPIRTISGPATTIVAPIGISVDVLGNVYLAERTGKYLVFGPAQNGNVAPLRTVTDSQAGSGFNGVGASIAGTTIVANANGSSHNEVDTFAKTANGSAAPTLAISGPSTALAQPVAIALFEQLQTVGARLTGENPTIDPHYGRILGYFNGTTATTTSVVMLTAGDPVQFKNVDSVRPHTVAFLGNATATSAPWPPTFTGGNTASASGTFIGATGFTTGVLNPGQKSRIYYSGGPGFYMYGCAFHYLTDGMRNVIVVL